jgi:FkbM family methyltransferase
MSSCIFTNDNNVNILLPNHPFSESLKVRDTHEPLFRKINTYLINNNIIKNNIIDLGAWVGDNSVPWAKNIDGLVYAIDPSLSNCNFIKDTCKLNNIENVKVMQYAISDKNELLSTNDNINHCSFYYGNPGINGATKINAVSLDFLFDNNDIENIGYIHLDVEGMELKILQGGQNILNKNRPIITFEQHLELDNYDDILRFLNENNYKVFLIDEVLKGCRPDCRNSFAFPNEMYNERMIININEHIGYTILISK